MNRKRIEYLDVTKGIGIILVVLGHVVSGDNYPMYGAGTLRYFIYSFHMPLFFVISGLCIKDEKMLNAETVKRMAEIYLIPYAAWTILYLFGLEISVVIMGKGSIINLENGKFVHAISICGIAPLWFLSALFIAEVIVLLMKPLLKNLGGHYIVIILLAALSIICSLWYSNLGDINLVLRNYLMGILRVFPTTLFVVIGYVFKDRIHGWCGLKLRKRVYALALMSCFQAAMCLVWNENIDVHVFRLANPWLHIAKALNGAAIVILLAQVIHSKLLVFIGGKSKELMILHYPPFYYTIVLRFILGKFFAPNIIGAVIITVVTVFCCILTVKIMSKFRIWKVLMGK